MPYQTAAAAPLRPCAAERLLNSHAVLCVCRCLGSHAMSFTLLSDKTQPRNPQNLRRWWHRKGDIFHLLLTLALVLDDR